MERLAGISMAAASRDHVGQSGKAGRRRRHWWIGSRRRERRSGGTTATPPVRTSEADAVLSGREELVARRGRAGRGPLVLRGAEPEAAISALVGGVVSEHTGPRSKARTYLNGEVITVVLTDTLTKGEERLVRDGMSELVLGTRRAFQQTIRQDLVAGIEEITGRKVRVSASEVRPDITVEVLVLDSSSEGEPDPSARQPL
jgi:uncharacterized protein YbcI